MGVVPTQGILATKAGRRIAPTCLLEGKDVVEIIQVEAEAARTSHADDTSGAAATTSVTATSLSASASARTRAVPSETGTRTCTWPRARSNNQW